MTISGLLAHPKFKHFLLLLKICFFSVAVLTADIVTDLLAAKEFFENGHYHWGLLTLVLISAPFAARVVISFLALVKCFKRESKFWLQLDSARFSFWKNDLWKLVWYFPILQPIR